MSDHATIESLSRMGARTLAIKTALRDINEAFGRELTFRECVQRYNFLYERYTVFKYIIGLDGVEFNREENFVHTKTYIWTPVITKYPLAEAYMLEGEPCWLQLCTIFDDKSSSANKTEQTREVVQISSDHDDSVQEWLVSMGEARDSNYPSITESFWSDLGQFRNQEANNLCPEQDNEGVNQQYNFGPFKPIGRAIRGPRSSSSSNLHVSTSYPESGNPSFNEDQSSSQASCSVSFSRNSRSHNRPK